MEPGYDAGSGNDNEAGTERGTSSPHPRGARAGLIPGTSAAVPDVAPELDVRGLSELDEDSARDLALVMTKWWTRLNRWFSIGVLTPMLGCTALSMASSFNELVFSLACAMLVANLPLAAIFSGIARREMRHETELLGYDRRTADAVVNQWVVARSSWLPKITRAQRERACVKALLEARDRGRHAGPLDTTNSDRERA